MNTSGSFSLGDAGFSLNRFYPSRYKHPVKGSKLAWGGYFQLQFLFISRIRPSNTSWKARLIREEIILEREEKIGSDRGKNFNQLHSNI